MFPVRNLPLLRQVVSSGATHSALYKESTVALSLHTTDAEAAIIIAGCTQRHKKK